MRKEETMTTEIICAGFGGQGVLTTGLILAQAGYRKNQKLTWYPSYGAEMRGGTANCNVKISDEEIGNPYCSELDILIAMNEPSLDRFEEMLKPGGVLYYNSDMVEESHTFRRDIQTVAVAANQLAAQAENPKGANIAVLGALAKKENLFTREELEEAMCEFFEKKGKGKFNSKNRAAYHAGYQAV
jgi:2-oxoglutarate ferredoxin oxidoreductase subunit gamma